MAKEIEIAKLNIDVKALITSASEVKKTLDDLRKSQADLVKQGDTNSAQFVKNASDIKSLTQAYSQQLGAIKAHTKATIDQETREKLLTQVLNQEVKSIQEARDQNRLLNQLRNQTNVTTEQGAEELTKLNAQLDRNNDFIKENADAYLQTKINVGNYAESVKDALNQINPLNGGLTGFIERANEAGGVAPLLTNSFQAMTTGIYGMVKASIAFIATPLGATLAVIGVAIASLVGLFKLGASEMGKTTEGTNKINGAMAKLSSILQPVIKFLKAIATEYLTAVIDAFNFLYDVVLKTVEIFGKFVEAIGFEDAGKGIQTYAQGVQQSAREQQKLLDMQDEFNKKQREARLIQLQYQKEAEKLRQIRDDESKSTNERIRANEELGVLLRKQMNEELAIQQLNLKAIEYEIQLKGNLTELEDKRIEALTQIQDIQERITGQQSEQLTNINSLKREAEQQAKERAQEAKRRADERKKEAIALLNAQLELYLSEQGIKEQSESKKLEIEQEASKRRIAIINAEYEASAKKESDKVKLKADLLNEQNALDLVEAQFAQEVSERTLAIFIENNRKKLTENKYISDELKQQELERLNDLEIQETQNLSDRYTNGLISKENYEFELLKIDNKYRDERLNLDREATEQQRAKDALDLQNRLATVGNNFMLEYELKTQQLEQERLLEIANAEKTGADIALINASYASQQKELDSAVMDNKLQLAQDTFGQLANIFGKESKAGKAMAVMQATVQTYQSAVSAYAGMVQTIPGPVGIALGAVAAASSVATGLQNVRKITSTKEAKFRDGGIMPIGGNLHTFGGTRFVGEDGTSFEAERGEGIAVLNRNAFSAFQLFNDSFRSGLGSSISQSLSGGNADIITAIKNMPAPIVTVEDINFQQNKVAKVVSGADF